MDQEPAVVAVRGPDLGVGPQLFPIPLSDSESSTDLEVEEPLPIMSTWAFNQRSAPRQRGEPGPRAARGPAATQPPRRTRWIWRTSVRGF